MEPVAFLLSKEVILNNDKIPDFQQLSGTDRLLPVETWSTQKIPSYIYIAQNWLSNKEMDDSSNSKAEILRKSLKKLKTMKYIWIDYCCVDFQNQERHRTSLSQLGNIIEHASRVFVLPLRSITSAIAPRYNVQSYVDKAWCIYESCYLLKRPSKIRMIQIRDKNGTHSPEMVSLPSSDQSDQIEHLLSAFTEIETIVKSGNRSRFGSHYKVSEPQDMELIWSAFVEQQESLFNGRRDAVDFFSYKIVEQRGKGVEWTPKSDATESNLTGTPTLMDVQVDTNQANRDLVEGDPIMAQFLGMKPRPGKIARANSDGSFDVQFDHGAKEVHVSPRYIEADAYVAPAVSRVGILKLEDPFTDKSFSEMPKFLNCKKLTIGKREKLVSVTAQCSWICKGGSNPSLILKIFDRNGEEKGSADLLGLEQDGVKISKNVLDARNQDFQRNILDEQRPGDTIAVWYNMGRCRSFQILSFKLEGRFSMMEEGEYHQKSKKNSSPRCVGCQGCIMDLFSWKK